MAQSQHVLKSKLKNCALINKPSFQIALPLHISDSFRSCQTRQLRLHSHHYVPLATQAVEILRELEPLTGNGRFVFPGERDRSRAMSNNTVNAALRRRGYSNTDDGTWVSELASALLNEQGWHPDAIERQLAHQEPNEIRAAYSYAKHVPKRRRMMQAWADYLQGLKVNQERRIASEVAAAPQGAVVNLNALSPAYGKGTGPALQKAGIGHIACPLER